MKSGMMDMDNELWKEIGENDAILVTNTLKNFFNMVYIIDLETGSFKELIVPDKFRKISSEIIDYDILVKEFAEKCVKKYQRNDVYTFFSLETIIDRLQKKEYIKQDFELLHLGWVRDYLMVAQRTENKIKKILFCSQDISKEKELELVIKEKEKKFNELYSVLCQDYDCCYYVTLDNNTAIPYKVTNKIQEEFGFMPMHPIAFDVAAKTYIEKAIHPDDREGLLEIVDPDNLKKLLKQSGTIDRTFRVCDRDSYIYWNVRIAKVYDKKHFSMVVGFGDVDAKMREEMSQKKDLEKAYEEAVQLRQGLLSDNIYLYKIVLSKDLIEDDIVCYADQGVISLLDEVGLKAPCSYNEFAKRFEKFVSQEYQEIYKQVKSCEFLLDAYTDGKESITYIFGVYTLNRKKIRILQQSNIFSKVKETGEIVCTCFAKDITGSIEKNAILTREHRLYRDALMAQAEFEYQFDVTEGIIHERFVTKQGLDVFNVIGIKAPISFDEFSVKRKSIMHEETILRQNEKYWTRDGLLEAYKQGKRNVEFDFYSGFEDRYFRISFLLSSPGSKNHIYAIVIGRDVTEDRKREDQYKLRLAKALEDAKRGNSAKTTFLSQMSHDIRTPLNGIIGLIELGDRHPDNIEMLRQDRIKAMIAAKHLLSLVNDVLEISKLDNDNVKLLREPFNIQELVNEIITICEIKALESDVKLIKDESDYKVPFVYGSPLHLRQIYLNIIGNSIKYNKKNGMVKTKMEIVSRNSNVVIYRFTISDTGIGMSEEFLHNIFNPFTQEHSDSRSVYHGTGLGMSIAKKLIDKMNGTIHIQSEVGVGSTFIISIPFAIANESTVEKTNSPSEQDNISGVNVLLVEDNELNMEIATCLLEEEGAIVTGVNNGKEAVDNFNNNPEGTYDIILMDVMMPVMNGYEATRTIRKLNKADAKSIPIIALTANAYVEDVLKAKNAGMNDHLSKPLDCSEMLNKISKCLNYPNA